MLSGCTGRKRRRMTPSSRKNIILSERKMWSYLDSYVMEEFKIEIFNKENPVDSFRHTTLNKGDSNWIIKNALEVAGISVDITSTQSLFKHMTEGLENQIIYGDQDIKDLLKDYFDSAEIGRDSLVFIIWDFESRVDQFKLQDILDFWDYIWYGPSDEALIIDCPGVSKILVVTDHGHIKIN